MKRQDINSQDLKEETIDVVSDLDDDEETLALEAARDEEAKKKEAEKPPKDYRNSIYANVNVKQETMDKIIIGLVIVTIAFMIIAVVFA